MQLGLVNDVSLEALVVLIHALLHLRLIRRLDRQIVRSIVYIDIGLRDIGFNALCQVGRG